jgi:hypothetical protein
MPIEPPLHPEFDNEQSTNCCSDKSGGVTPFVLAQRPSIVATAANAQQLPQLPWSLTLDT